MSVEHLFSLPNNDKLAERIKKFSVLVFELLDAIEHASTTSYHFFYSVPFYNTSCDCALHTYIPNMQKIFNAKNLPYKFMSTLLLAS